MPYFRFRVWWLFVALVFALRRVVANVMARRRRTVLLQYIEKRLFTGVILSDHIGSGKRTPNSRHFQQKKKKIFLHKSL
jgi:hypothetical protein